MSVEQELQGQRKLKALIRAHVPDASVEISAASPEDMYTVTISRPGKAYWLSVAAETLSDLANNGGVGAALEGLIVELLASEPVWHYTCPECAGTLALYARPGNPVPEDAKRYARQHHDLHECSARRREPKE